MKSMHPISKKFLLLALLAMAGLTLCPDLMMAQPRSDRDVVVITGWSRVYKDNLTRAREQAIASALRAAVDRVLGNQITAETRTAYLKTLAQQFYTNPGPFIRNYKVLTEARAANEYYVLIEATVSFEGLKQQLATANITRRVVQLPTILPFITEHSLLDIAPRYWWSTPKPRSPLVAQDNMMAKLRQQGFRPVDTTSRIAQATTINVQYQPNLSETEAVALASKLKAGLVLLGEASVTESPNKMADGSRTFQARMKVSALRTDTGTPIQVVERVITTLNHDQQLGARQALINAGKEVGKVLADTLPEKWRKTVDQPAEILILVEGTENLANFAAFRSNLATIEGVENVRMTQMTFGTANLAVAYKGPPHTLAQNLMLTTFEHFGLNIYDITENQIKLRLEANTDRQSTTPATVSQPPVTD